MLDDEALPGGLSDAASAAWLTRRYGLQSVASRTGGVGELRQTVGEVQAVTRALAAKGCQLGHRFTHAFARAMKGSTLQINRQYEAALQAAPPTAGSLALVLRENARRGDVAAVAKYFKHLRRYGMSVKRSFAVPVIQCFAARNDSKRAVHALFVLRALPPEPQPRPSNRRRRDAEHAPIPSASYPEPQPPQAHWNVPLPLGGGGTGAAVPPCYFEQWGYLYALKGCESYHEARNLFRMMGEPGARHVVEVARLAPRLKAAVALFKEHAALFAGDADASRMRLRVLLHVACETEPYAGFVRLFSRSVDNSFITIVAALFFKATARALSAEKRLLRSGGTLQPCTVSPFDSRVRACEALCLHLVQTASLSHDSVMSMHHMYCAAHLPDSATRYLYFVEEYSGPISAHLWGQHKQLLLGAHA